LINRNIKQDPSALYLIPTNIRR